VSDKVGFQPNVETHHPSMASASGNVVRDDATISSHNSSESSTQRGHVITAISSLKQPSLVFFNLNPNNEIKII
jgi:uncharacterized DUF497 family protein